MAKTEAQRAKMLNDLKCFQIHKAKNKVAANYQEMVRWESAAKSGGMITCCTCGKTEHVNGGGFHAGHFIGGRHGALIFHPMNAHTQCHKCNTFLHGNLAAYKEFMLQKYGLEAVEELEALGRTTKQFTHEELVDLKIEFLERTRIAKAIVKGTTQ